MTYINNISNDAIVRGPTEQTKLFVKMGCIIHRRDFGLAWFIALDQWDKRLSDSGLRLENPDSKELQNIINEGNTIMKLIKAPTLARAHELAVNKVCNLQEGCSTDHEPQLRLMRFVSKLRNSIGRTECCLGNPNSSST